MRDAVHVALCALEHVRNAVDERLDESDEDDVTARAAEARLLDSLRKRFERARLVVANRDELVLHEHERDRPHQEIVRIGPRRQRRGHERGSFS